MLDKDIFKTIVLNTPLVSIDLIVRNKKKQVLVGKRVNRPAQGLWFVPGGRILKDERMSNAFSRITNNELGVPLSIHQAEFIGPYEHFYDDNFSTDEFSTHYVVLAFEVLLEIGEDSLPKSQHNEYRWMTEQEILESDATHPNNYLYFQSNNK